MDIKEYLDKHAERINNPSFIENDPVKFPRRYKDLRDIDRKSTRLNSSH